MSILTSREELSTPRESYSDWFAREIWLAFIPNLQVKFYSQQKSGEVAKILFLLYKSFYSQQNIGEVAKLLNETFGWDITGSYIYKSRVIICWICSLFMSCFLEN